MTHAPLLTQSGSYDRAAIMRDAHRQFRQMRALGWTFGRCLSFSWAKARAMREAQLVRQGADRLEGRRPHGQFGHGSRNTAAANRQY